MFHTNNHFNKTLRSLGKEPLSNEESLVLLDKVRAAVADARKRPHQPMLTTYLATLKSYRVQLTALAAVTAVVAITASAYVLQKNPTSSNIVAETSATPLPSPKGIAYIDPNLPTPDLAAPVTPSPTAPIGSQGGSQDATATPTPSPAATATPVSTTPLQLDLEDTYSYRSNADASTVSGVRDPEATVSFLNSFIPVAKAANTGFSVRAYPAVFNANLSTKGVVETNIYTGKSVEVTGETVPAFIPTFSNSRQAVAYLIGDPNNLGCAGNLKVRYLNSRKTETLSLTAATYGLAFSPNGTKLAYMQVDSRCTQTSELRVYDMISHTSKAFRILEDLGIDQPLGFAHFAWTGNDNIAYYYYHPRDPRKYDPATNTYLGKKLTVSSGAVATLSSALPAIFQSPITLGNKVIGMYYTQAEADEYGSLNGAPPKKLSPIKASLGYLAYMDLSTNTLVPMSDKTGLFVKSWLVTADASKIVFVNAMMEPGATTRAESRLGLKMLDMKTGVVTDMPIPSLYENVEIIGWNGNENNVLVGKYNGASGFSTIFYNLNLKTKVLTQITK